MRFILLALCFCIQHFAIAQSPLTSGFFNYHLTDRYEIISDSIHTDFFSGIKPFRRDAISQFANKLSLTSKTDQFNQDYLRKDNILFEQDDKSLLRKPLFKHFYKSESTFYLVKQDHFKLIVNPILGLFGSTDAHDELKPYTNSRGAEIRGSVGNKVGFYSYAIENQQLYPNYIRDQHTKTGVVYGTTLTKRFKQSARDYFNAAGHITFSPIDEIMVQFGNDKNFIGNGFRSLILSDMSTPYPFLKLNTKVWKINYMNLYSQHVDFIAQGESANNGRKFSALHHLSMNIGKNVTLGLFENIIFDRSDSNETNQYDIAYLNPIIFYRAVEHGLNSNDNASLGMDIKWNFLNRFSVYGQLVLDEFVKDQLFGRTQSWVNKWAYQAGLKYINVANVKNLDLQLEVNQLRPYLNQHRTKAQNWIHYNQSLAHPLGSNLREWIAIVRYQPINRLFINATYSHSVQGLDSNEINYGGDYLKTYYNRPKGAIPMFSGLRNTVSHLAVEASYMLWHNLFLDAALHMRTQSNALLIADHKNMLINVGLRMNLAPFNYRQ